MHNLLQLVVNSKAFQKILKNKKNHFKIAGVNETENSLLIAALFACHKKPIVVFLSSRDEIRMFKHNLSVFFENNYVFELYPNDFSQVDRQNKSLEITKERISLLKKLHNNEPVILLMETEALSQKMIDPNEVFYSGLDFAVSSQCDMTKIVAEFVEMGYERCEIVDAPGQFCVRGGIVDIFPLDQDNPIRIEWFDNEIDSIRIFNVDSQRSFDEIKQVKISPIIFLKKNELNASIFDYMPEETYLILNEAQKISEELTRLITSEQVDKSKTITWEKIESSILKRKKVFALSSFNSDFLNFTEVSHMKVSSIAPYHRQIELLEEDLKNYIKKGITPIITMSQEGKARGFSRSLKNKGIPSEVWLNDSSVSANCVNVTVSNLSKGFIIDKEKWVVITEEDIFGFMKRRRMKSKIVGSKIKYFSDIKAGDYVVHSVHGIGKYLGSETILVSGVNRDYIVIRYAGDDKLYVPVDQVQTLQKYIGADGHIPRLSKMGGSDWNRIKTRTKAAVTEMAAELLRLQAERKLIKGHAFSADTVWQKEFEEAFTFEETPDQLQAVEEIKEDMEKPYPMDRILCGDVGYGKTEVAIRAAFKAVMDGKQVAVLVPTTILAQQHFITFSERMMPFGLSIDMVSRFRTAKEQKETLAKVSEGKVDVLIGTHRLIQSDVKFKDLGLLVIDEEQRFGVGQKEKIKYLTKNVDVLVLSATPIPRTLHMGLTSARDMSIIETPPEDRLPVETYVAEYNDDLVQNAILKEMRRGGYVYYVYNRVRDIDKIAEKLELLVPEAKIKIVHGQLSEDILEASMIDFYEGHFDILVCTSIIENGLDVPFANTIIIHGAENFGLSQLYQMRGRVGRTNRLAYAYFLYPKQKSLTQIAEKRLQAIRDFTDLGAGFRIAMRDLEIRGAGNILGAQQSGHLLSVGFETYCKLLEETVKELSEEGSIEENKVDTIIEFDINAYIPDDFIDDPGHKLDVYKRLITLDSNETMSDLLDEILDRFGSPPKVVINLLTISMLKGMGRKLGIRNINLKKSEVKIVFDDSSKVQPNKLLLLVTSSKYAATLKQGPPIEVRLFRPKNKDPLVWLEGVFNELME